jgi:nucleoside-diphosphate-sugar epimerase
VRAVVTGAAGFIGSHLVDRLLEEGDEVVGIDALTDYYDPATKRANLGPAMGRAGFRFEEVDVLDADLDRLFEGADRVFHLATQPGVRLSWDRFEAYSDNNVVATQRVLEAVRRGGMGRLVMASSSSVYGNAKSYPVDEASPTEPFSPYGVTKLAAEKLCGAYAENWRLPVVSLRYFTVYGPRQRPDMSIHRLVESALTGTPFPLYGAAGYWREFTYVDDIVEATVRAATAELEPGEVLNVAGGESLQMADLVERVGSVVGRAVPVDEQPAKPGDAYRNGGATERARHLLGWTPRIGLDEGLAAQVAWHRSRART